MQRILYFVMAFVIMSLCSCSGQYLQTIDLTGKWYLALDKEDKGIGEKWFQQHFNKEQINLPGSLQMQGFGEKPSLESDWTIGNITTLLKDKRYAKYTHADDFICPYWLTPKRVYVGPAWYQKTVTIPKSWENKRIVLLLERPHWKTTVWVDDKNTGSQNTLGTAHEYNLTDYLNIGQHKITIRVDNRVLIDVAKDAHSVSDQTQTNWNGIIGQIKLTATDKVWIEDVQVYPNVQNNKIKVKAQIGNLTGTAGQGTLTVQAKNKSAICPKPKTIPIQWSNQNQTIEFEYDMGDNVKLWDEFSPNLYTLSIKLAGDNVTADKETIFGMRQLGISKSQFTLNGRKLFLRGTLECSVFPRTGYPPTCVESWKKIIGICKHYGLNHIRFHSWCPPEAAFAAADEMGFFFQVECSTWATFGNGTAVDKWVYKESEHILKEYGNHPSFILMSAGNESHGKNREAFLGKLVNYWKEQDNRRFYTGTTGWPMIPQNDYHTAQGPRLQLYEGLRLTDRPNTNVDYRKFIQQTDKPILSHEVGQWCAYPNVDEIKKYNGLTRAGTIEIPLDFLKRAGLESRAKDFLMASGKFQALLYKQEIEAALRTPGMAGFQLLGLYDYPGWGLATVGVLDAFWESKGYITAKQYRRFCSQTVPLARLQKFVYTNTETLQAKIDLAHYGSADIEIKPSWRLRDENGNIVSSGMLKSSTAKTGGLSNLGEINISLKQFVKAEKLNLEISVDNINIANDWNIWVYPAKVKADQSNIVIAESLDKKTVDALKSGKNVLLMPLAYSIKADTLGTFKPIFWNRVTFTSQREHHLGILCDPNHPALADFPTDYYCNWQWWDLMQNCKPVIVDDLPGRIEPIVRVIDDWALCRNLGLVFEVSVAKGKLLFCSIDLAKDLQHRPVARQLRYSLMNYINSEKFKPVQSVTVQDLKKLFKEPSLMQKLGAKISYADSVMPSNEAFQAIDNNPNTFWVTTWMPKIVPYPHEIQIEVDSQIKIKGFTYLPRQDGNHNGWICEYEFYVSEDGKNWNKSVAKGSFAEDKSIKRVLFNESCKGKYFRLVAVKGFNGDPFAAIAELSVITED